MLLAFLTMGVINPFPISTAKHTSQSLNVFILPSFHYELTSFTYKLAKDTAFIIKSLIDILLPVWLNKSFLNLSRLSIFTFDSK